MAEALHSLRWQSFLDSQDAEKGEEYRSIMTHLHAAYPTPEFLSHADDERFKEMLKT